MPTSETVRAQRFAAYVDRLAAVLGHRDRHAPLRAYVTGLCLPGGRKSIEPMAARVDPRHVQSRHQSMHHFVADAPWDAAAVLRVARDWVLAPMARHGAVAAWIVGGTGLPKKGEHSVGVARQYCGVLGKQDNCQVAVSVSVANEAVSLPVAYQLYLPESWAGDRRRRRGAGGPRRRPAPPPRGAGAGRRPRREEGDHGGATGRSPAAAKTMDGPRPPAHVRAAYHHAHPPESQATGRRAADDGVADGDVARRDGRHDALPLHAAARG